MDIQVVMDQGIGNMIMLTPALRAIREQRPDAQITILCKPPADQVIRGWKVIDRVITEPDDREYDLTFLSIWSDEYRKKYGQRLIAKSKESRQVPVQSWEIHEGHHHLKTARFLGYQGKLLKPFCRTTKVDLPWKSDVKVIALSDTTAPLEAWKRKRWGKYPELAKELVDKGYRVVLVGGEAETKIYDEQDWPFGVENLAGRYTIPETAYILKHCDAFIGNDSGPAHIAAAVGTKTHVLFGATKPAKNKPLGKAVWALSANLPCSPCQYTSEWDKCLKWACMEDISVDNVINQLENPPKLLDRPSVSACMIVQDNEDTLPKTLESIKGVVDEIIIADTGSKDKTVEIAESFGAEVYHFKHESEDDYIHVDGYRMIGNFSEARNFSIGKGSKDWILIIDSDEVLPDDNGEKIHNALRRFQDFGYEENAIRFNVSSDLPHNSESLHQHERLFRHGCIKYERRVHNQPKFPGRFAVSDIRLHHTGYATDAKTQHMKQKRTELLLNKELEDDPLDQFTHQNLLRNYRAGSRWKDIIETCDRFYKGIKLAGLSVNPQTDQMMRVDTVVAHQALAMEAERDARVIQSDGDLEEAERLMKLSQERWATSRDLCDELHRQYPDNMDASMYLGVNHYQLDEFEKAIASFKHYIQLRESAELGSRHVGIIEDTWGSKAQAWCNMGLSYAKMNNLVGAMIGVWIAAELEPDNDAFQSNLKALFTQVMEKVKKQEQPMEEDQN